MTRMIRLPELTWELDCGPLGYPGLVVEMILNPSGDEREPLDDGAPWDNEFYWIWGHIFKAVHLPADYSESGEPVSIVLMNGEDLYDLEHMVGFDPQVLTWAMRQYTQKRQERLQAEVKN